MSLLQLADEVERLYVWKKKQNGRYHLGNIGSDKTTLLNCMTEQ
jgi:hypothetical protein